MPVSKATLADLLDAQAAEFETDAAVCRRLSARFRADAEAKSRKRLGATLKAATAIRAAATNGRGAAVPVPELRGKGTIVRKILTALVAGPLPIDELAKGVKPKKQAVYRLAQRGLIVNEGGAYRLTDAGAAAAQ
jgi:hypothetical protein